MPTADTDEVPGVVADPGTCRCGEAPPLKSDRLAGASADPKDLIAAKDRLIAELEAKLQAALALIAELEAKLNRNSTNSSKPPSSDPPWADQKKKREPSGRKPGGQPGHAKHERKVVPPEKVDRFHDIFPTCPCCNRKLEKKMAEPRIHQSVELPPIRPEVDQFNLHDQECEDCHVWARAELPPGVPTRMLGPNLVALVTACSGLFRHSKRITQEFLSLVLNLDLSLGSVANAEQEMSRALEAPVDEVAEHVPQQANVNMDETGHREGRENGHSRRAWLWIVATGSVALFKIATSRGADVAKAILGVDFKGILGSDRWSSYRWIDACRRQLCWAHLIRDFQGWVDAKGQGARLGAAILAEVKKMFEWWHRVRDGTLTRAEFQRLMAPVEARILSLLEEALVCELPKVVGMAKQILTLQAALFTFVHVTGIDPTNNLCERLLRHAVMWRKTSYGTQSPNGSRFVERILTAVTTLRLQDRNVLAYLATAYRAHLTGTKPPSLLPSGA